MKGRILALLLSLIISGTAGVYAKTASEPASSAPSAGSATTEVSSHESSSQKASSAEEVSSAQSSGNASSSANSAVPVKTSASSCPTSYNGATAEKTVSQNSSPATATAQNSKPSTNSSNNCYRNTQCDTSANCDTEQNNCNNGTYLYCLQNYGCNQLNSAGNSNSSYINDIISRLTGKTCSQPSSGNVSSNPTTSTPSGGSSNHSDNHSGNSSSPASSSSGNTATGTYADFQNQVLQLVNKERTSRGLGALTMDSALNNTATLKSQDMAKLGYFDHTSPTYGSPFDMMKQFGISYRTAGENIAMGQTSPEQVMNGWMNSEGHRANILNSSFTKIGIGIAQNSSGRYYWTQQFTG